MARGTVARVCALLLSVAASLPLVAVRLPVHASTSSERQAFVRVRGTELTLSGRPFRFVGANVSVIHGPNERRNYEAVLDAVKKDGLKVIRLWALGESPAPGKPHTPMYAFRIGQEGWVDASFVHLDKVLSAAKARDLRVIVVLANRWKDYGGIGTYLGWAGVRVARDPRGEPLGTALSSFYACESCQTQYRRHVQRVVGRVNSVSGVAYRDDPTILAWELINEASAVTAKDEETLFQWVRQSAHFIRTLDANHLISAGHIGYNTSSERRVWRNVQSLSEIDFADVHAYPLGDPRVSSAARLARFVGDPVALAHSALHKPLVFGEFGFARPNGMGAESQRARWVSTFLTHAAESGAAGALIWHYEPAANVRRSHSITEDPSDKSSLRVRRALLEAVPSFRGTIRARRVAGERPRFAFATTQRETLFAHRGFVQRHEGLVLEIDPTQFWRARFERTGVYRLGPLATVYGAGEGSVEYRFVAPRVTPRSLIVEARMSSELPGYGFGDDPRDGSDVEVSIDGRVVAITRAAPDNGLGEVARVELRDARLLARLFQTARRHSLRFRALPSPHTGGLCLYGKATGSMPLEPSFRRAVDSVRITLSNQAP